jgi:DNA-binding response OmpR family regulator
MKKILIVEDDQLLANIYSNRFAREGFQVKIALDGQAGLDLVHSFEPDAVVLDLMLPKLTGVELTRRIRTEGKQQELPIIVFSNAHMTSMMQQATRAGANKCLSKASTTPKEVVEVVRRLLSSDGQSGTAPATPVSHPAPAADPDAALQAEVRESLMVALPAAITALRTLLQRVIKTQNESARLDQVHDMYGRMHVLSDRAGVAGLPHVSRISDALEALLKALHDRPVYINASALRTVATAVDFLADLLKRGTASPNLESPPPLVLVVDDDAVSARAVSHALNKAKLKSISLQDSAAALELLAKDRFDLVFLDVDMPGLNGHEVCTRLRAMPANKSTPVVFVTRLNDFDTRAHSTASGGNDFITKPFLFIELALRALVYVFRNRLRGAK